MIYLDHAATTPVDARVVEAMLPFFSTRYGNPSSVYAAGRDARAALDWARQAVASVLGAQEDGVIFTSGATEADALAIVGGALAARACSDGRRTRVIISAIEHHAVLHSAESLRERGFTLDIIPPASDGIVPVAAVQERLGDDVALVSLMLANNEIGTIQPVAVVAAAVRASGATMHTDAVQAVGQLPVSLADLGVDLLSVSAHKVYGPRGVGALLTRKGVPLTPQLLGGSQEGNRRAGTENVAGIVGFAAALMLAHAELDDRAAHLLAMRSLLLDELAERIPHLSVNGDLVQRLPNNLNVLLPGTEAQALLQRLDLHDIAAASGSACATGSPEPSHVLLALGLPERDARASLRLTTGKDTTAQEIRAAAQVIQESVEVARAASVPVNASASGRFTSST